MTRLTVDGQPRDRDEPMPPINFCNVDQPDAVHEVPLEMWFEANGWISTVRMDLDEGQGT